MNVQKFVPIVVIAGLTACDASSVESSPASPMQAPQVNTSQAAERTELATALSTFASPSGKAWDAYDSLPGVVWLGSSPSPSEYAPGRYEKNGRLTLNGFALAKLPNGKPGVEYTTVEGNEGQSGLTLTGDQNQVQGMSVKKFYFSEDYRSVLQKQLGPKEKIAPLASGCIEDNEEEFSSKPGFFQISLPEGSVFVEASLEKGGKYSPGYTVFDFTREEPLARMQELNCQVE